MKATSKRAIATATAIAAITGGGYLVKNYEAPDFSITRNDSASVPATSRPTPTTPTTSETKSAEDKLVEHAENLWYNHFEELTATFEKDKAGKLTIVHGICIGWETARGLVAVANPGWFTHETKGERLTFVYGHEPKVVGYPFKLLPGPYEFWQKEIDGSLKEGTHFSIPLPKAIAETSVTLDTRERNVEVVERDGLSIVVDKETGEAVMETLLVANATIEDFAHVCGLLGYPYRVSDTKIGSVEDGALF